MRFVRTARSATAAMAVAVTFGIGACSTSPGQQMSQGIELPSSTPATTTATALSAAQTTKTGRWWSGASGPGSFNGTYARWRRSPLAVGGTWDNGDAEQVAMQSICAGGEWSRWAKPLDVAIGAIDKRVGETWAKAAAGAYDARWRKNLLQIKKCWGKRNAAYLYIRFAHEMNLGSMRWNVKAGEEADFVKAITRYSDLRYTIIPKANIVLCPSDGTDVSLGLDVRKLWPGRDAKGRLVANVYSIDTYNGYVVVRTVEEFGSKLLRLDDHGYLFGMETHREFALQMGVPFAVSEWSNNGDPNDAGHGGEAPDYVRMMNDYFREYSGDPSHPKPGQLLYEVQFNQLAQFSFLPTKLQPRTAAAYRAAVWGH